MDVLQLAVSWTQTKLTAERMKSEPRGARAILISSIGNAATPVSAFLLAPILARSLGVDGRGEVAAATAPLLLVAILLSFGLVESTTYWVARQPQNAYRVGRLTASILLAVGLVGIALILLISPMLAGFDATVADLIRVCAFALPVNIVVGGLRAVAAGLKRWRVINYEKVLTAATRLVVIGFVWIFSDLSILQAAVVIAWSPVIGCIAYFFLFRALARQPIGEFSAEPTLQKVLGYGGKIWLGGLAGLLLSRLDQVLLTPLAGTYELGLYVVAVNVSEVVLIGTNSVRDVLFAYEAADGKQDRLGSVSRIATLCTLALCVVLSITSYFLVPIFFGVAFSGAIPAIFALSLSSVVLVPGSVASAGLSARGHPGLRSWSLVVGVITNVLALVVLTPAFGALGAGLATLIGTLAMTTANLLFLRIWCEVTASSLLSVSSKDVRALLELVRKLRISG